MAQPPLTAAAAHARRPRLAPRDHHDQFVSGRVPSQVVQLESRADHHQPAFLPIGAVLGGVASQEVRSPLEVGYGNNSRLRPRWTCVWTDRNQ